MFLEKTFWEFYLTLWGPLLFHIMVPVPPKSLLGQFSDPFVPPIEKTIEIHKYLHLTLLAISRILRSVAARLSTVLAA